jgi:hypothetical protein
LNAQPLAHPSDDARQTGWMPAIVRNGKHQSRPTGPLAYPAIIRQGPPSFLLQLLLLVLYPRY